jgi:formylglycine-generating enzyme required for sulfatase activity
MSNRIRLFYTTLVLLVVIPACSNIEDAYFEYGITVGDLSGGEGSIITPSSATSIKGRKIVLAVVPADGKQLVAGSLSVNGGAVAVSSNTPYAFTMPASNVTVTATFEAGGFSASITYLGNGNTGGSVPTDASVYSAGQSVTVRPNSGSLVKGGLSFLCWSTNTAGTGKRFAPGATLVYGNTNLVFHAQYGLVPDMVNDGGVGALQMGWPGINTVHIVAMVSAYSIARHELNWAIWTNVRNWAIANGYSIGTGRMGSVAGGAGMNASHPVTMVSWRDCVAWCNALSEYCGLVPVYYTESEKTVVYRNASDADATLVKVSTVGAEDCVLWNATGYRLPTEVEWEWAARKAAGFISDGDKPSGYYGATLYTDGASFVLDQWGPYAWYDGNAGGTTHPAGLKLPNYLGLKDMSGNVWEYCWDWYSVYSTGAPYTNAESKGAYSGTDRASRGGPMAASAEYLRTAENFPRDPGTGYADCGLRPARHYAGPTP